MKKKNAKQETEIKESFVETVDSATADQLAETTKELPEKAESIVEKTTKTAEITEDSTTESTEESGDTDATEDTPQMTGKQKAIAILKKIWNNDINQ